MTETKKELTLDYLLNEPVKFVQDFYLQKATTDSVLDHAKLSELVNQEENIFPHFVETLLNMQDSSSLAEATTASEEALSALPSVNQCMSKEALREHDTKLVRFDCQILDMFEEEYFVPIMPDYQPAEASGTGPVLSQTPLVYKYHSELSEVNQNAFQADAMNGGMMPQGQPLERGNLLASSLIHMQGWAGQSAQASGQGIAQKVLLKLYDKDIRSFKLNEVVTCVGVLEYSQAQADAAPQQFDHQGDSQMTNEEQNIVSPEQMAATAVPNEDCLPHLHVVTYRKNYAVNTLKQLPQSQISENYVTENQSQINSTYQKCVAFLKMFLSNDKHAAEYLMMSLVSRTYRREGALLIGDLNVNLSGVTPDQASLICEFVQAVNPLVCRFDATVDSLSQTRFTPRKNYDTNQMEEGLMGSLVNGTVLLFDETKMLPGKLINHGVDNIKALATLIEQQAIILDFQYHQQEMPMQIPVIVLSETRTMFKNTIHVPIEGEVTDENIAVAKQKLAELKQDEEMLNEMRQYFIALGLHQDISMKNYEMPAQVSEHAQAKFIEARKSEHEKEGKVKTDDFVFHRFLVLARYFSIAKAGSLELSIESYDQAQELEIKRVQKVDARTPKAKQVPETENQSASQAAASVAQ